MFGGRIWSVRLPASFPATRSIEGRSIAWLIACRRFSFDSAGRLVFRAKYVVLMPVLTKYRPLPPFLIPNGLDRSSCAVGGRPNWS